MPYEGSTLANQNSRKAGGSLEITNQEATLKINIVELSLGRSEELS